MTDLIVIEKGDPDEQSDMEIAKWIGAALQRHYPDHPWVVCVQGKAIIVRQGDRPFCRALRRRIARSLQSAPRVLGRP